MARGMIDFSYLENFAAGDEALLAEVLNLFLDQAKGWRAELSSPAPAEALHALKGSARGIGAGPLGDLCEAAERGGSTAAVRAGLEAVTGEIEAYLAHIGGD